MRTPISERRRLCPVRASTYGLPASPGSCADGWPPPAPTLSNMITAIVLAHADADLGTTPFMSSPGEYVRFTRFARFLRRRLAAASAYAVEHDYRDCSGSCGRRSRNDAVYVQSGRVRTVYPLRPVPAPTAGRRQRLRCRT